MNDDTKAEIARLIHQMLLQNTEEEQDAVHDRIERLSPDPEWSKYVFHSSEFYGETEKLDILGVVEKIAAYEPIIIQADGSGS